VTVGSDPLEEYADHFFLAHDEELGAAARGRAKNR
jgi:hypothetical protein